MRSRAHKALLAAAGVGLLLASSSCAALRARERDQAVSRAAERFHEHLKASRFEEIYAEASQDLRDGQPKEEFVRKLREVRARLGAIVGVEESPFPGRQEDKEFDWVITSFDLDGSEEDGRELVAWRVSETEARLDRYRVSFKEGEESVNLTP